MSQEYPLLAKLRFKIPPFSFISAYHIASLFITPEKLAEAEYDIIIAHAWECCYIAHLIFRKRKIPFIGLLWDPASYLINRIYSKTLPAQISKIFYAFALQSDRTIARYSQALITAATPMVSEFKQFTKKKVNVVQPGCYPLDKIPEKRGDYAFTIDRWDIGNLPHPLLEIIKKMDKKIRLVVAGFWWPEELQKSFLHMRDMMGLTDQVEVLGPVTEEKLIDLYKGARVWLLGRDETINICAMEAAACGCPVMMLNETDLFEHEVHGFFPENEEEYVYYLDKLFSNERLAWEMGKRAWNLMKKYTWRNHAARIEKIILTSKNDL